MICIQFGGNCEWNENLFFSILNLFLLSIIGSIIGANGISHNSKKKITIL